MGCGGFGGWC